MNSLEKKIYLSLKYLITPKSNKNFSFEDRSIPIKSRDDKNIIKKIADSYHKAKNTQNNVSSIYKPGKEWEEIIKTKFGEYLEALNNSDISTKLEDILRNFFRVGYIGGLLCGSNYSNITNDNFIKKRIKKKIFIKRITEDYLTWKDLIDGDLKEVSAPMIGDPFGCCIGGHLITRLAFRHHYHAILCKNLLIEYNKPVIAEIGGGYGGLAYYLINSLKEKSFTYINFDLPEILPIISYYLMNAFPNKRIFLFGEDSTERLSLKTINSYDMILLPNFEIPKLEEKTVDLFVNFHSLSEMDFPTVQEYISVITKACKRYFFHENSNYRMLKSGGHIEIPADQFSISNEVFKRIYKVRSPWFGDERYKEYLYEKISKR
jgi:hypothetical protein